MPFTEAQINQLLAAVNPVRVMRDGKGNAHLPQQDVLAHLTRIFGFGAFDYEMLSCELVFEQQHRKRNGETPDGRFDVCYKATMRLTVRDPEGNVVCRFEDGSTGDSSNQTRADGHDLAMKSAISLAKKRCAIALGDQFGLSLYNKGQTTALVKNTLIRPSADTAETPEVADVQRDVPPSLSMGYDEVERERHADEAGEGAAPTNGEQRSAPVANQARTVTRRRPPQPSAADLDALAKELRADVELATNREQLQRVWKLAVQLDASQCTEIRGLTEAKVAALAENVTAA
ncbi:MULTISPECIES: Rad52/Rad22 family DNA repair protein [Nocardia]|uniref:Rad52/Rad22 family DNA repair protein n=1 Tax=Nocardia TaxID=1817 RepID=UPI000D697D28|nr:MULTISPECIES: Rad52/Rad22 family DNA repair protein [Nocardia]